MAVVLESTIQIRLLGGFDVRLDGRPVLDASWSRKKEQALVKLLALQPSRSLQRDAVLAALWPHQSATAAPTNLRKVRHTLARTLRERGLDRELIILTGDELALASDVAVDVAAFRAAAAEALTARTSPELCERALKLWQGELLPGEDFEDWVLPAKTAITALHRDLLFHLARLYQAQSEYANALECGEKLVALDATDEAAHRLVMETLARTGQRERALRQFTVCSETLRQQLGTDPEEETIALAEQLRTRSLAPARSKGTGTGQLVGRASEIQVVRSALDGAIAGSGRAVLLAGEAGIGKTRLVEELALHAQLGGTRMVWGRCYEDEGLPGFWPWVQVVRSLTPRENTPRAGIASLLTVEGSTAISQLDQSDQTEGARLRLYASVADVLRTASSAQPLVVALDDLHWADGDSLHLLRFAARELRDARVLFIGTYRDDEVTEGHPLTAVVHDVLRLSSSRQLSLTGLSRDEVAQLVERLVGGDAPGSFVDELTARAKGNPLYITEALRLVGAERARSGGTSTWSVNVPGQAQEIIRRRLERLTPECLRLLEMTAVIGQEFSVALLERIAELRRIDVLAMLDEAVRDRTVAELSEGIGRFGFVHPLIREVLYGDLALDYRVRLHLRVGEALEQLHEEDLDQHLPELAHHFYRAAAGGGGSAKAVDYMRKAADAAGALLAYEEAVRLYEGAIRVLDSSMPVDRGLRGDLRLALGWYQRRLMDKATVLATLRGAVDDARAAGDAALFARAVVEYTRASHGAMPDYDSIRLVDEALVWLGDGHHHTRARVLGQLANLLALTPEEDRRARVSEDAVSLARSTGDPELLAHTLVNWHDANSGPDNLAERVRRLSEAVGLAQAAADGALRCNARQRLIAAHLELGDMTAFDRELAVLESVATKYRIRNYQKWSAILRAARSMLTGAFDAAEEQAREGFAFGQEVGDRDAASVLGAQLFQLRWDQGRLHELEPLVRQQTSALPAWSAASAVMEIELGRTAQARARFDALAAILDKVPRDRFWVVTMLLLSHVCVHVGDAARAAQLYDLLRPFAARTGVLSYGQLCTGSNERTLAMLATVLERYAEAQGHFERALRENKRTGALPFLARTQVDYTRMLLQRAAPGDAGLASTVLGEARATAVELGMAGVLREIQAMDVLSAPSASPRTVTP